MGLRKIYGKGPHTLLKAGWLVANGKILGTGTPNRLNYCVIFMLHTQFANAAADCITQPGGLYAARGSRIGEPLSKT
jgi:hypothetical protein